MNNASEFLILKMIDCANLLDLYNTLVWAARTLSLSYLRHLFAEKADNDHNMLDVNLNRNLELII